MSWYDVLNIFCRIADSKSIFNSIVYYFFMADGN